MLSVLLSLAFEAIWFGAEPSCIRPFSSIFQFIFSFFGEGTMVTHILFYFFWWAHLLILLSFMVYVPQSKHAHLLFAPSNILVSSIGPPTKMAAIDYTDQITEESGAGKIKQF